MFELSQRYLSSHYDAETGETSGNAILLQIFLRYQRMRWWWRWHKEQPTVTSLPKALYQMAYVAVHKATY